MNQEEIHQAFLETRYIVHLDKDVILRIGGEGLELISRIPNLRSWAFLTAWNPLPDILSLSENQQRQARMEEALRSLGYRIHPGLGVSADGQWSEASCLIEDISLDAAQEMAARFGQLAFVFGTREMGNELVYT
jgi:hypothetical protein